MSEGYQSIYRSDLFAGQTVLVTGGVHGYETSGVQGALRFLQEDLRDFESHFTNIKAVGRLPRDARSPWPTIPSRG